MGGICETCSKKDGCTKIIGAMFGFCNTDYEEEFIESMREKVVDKIMNAEYIRDYVKDLVSKLSIDELNDILNEEE